MSRLVEFRYYSIRLPIRVILAAARRWQGEARPNLTTSSELGQGGGGKAGKKMGNIFQTSAAPSSGHLRGPLAAAPN